MIATKIKCPKCQRDVYKRIDDNEIFDLSSKTPQDKATDIKCFGFELPSYRYHHCKSKTGVKQ